MNALTITHYERRHRQAAFDLAFRSHRIHSHLDWHTTDQWIDITGQIIRLAWIDKRLVGMIGVSVPVGRSCWLRIVALAEDIPIDIILFPLWKAICHAMREQKADQVALLQIEDWLASFIGAMGFKYDEDIVTLSRTGNSKPDPTSDRLPVRLATLKDLRRMTEIDHVAFQPPWRLSLDDLRYAKRLATTCTVTHIDGEIAGYQISTTYQQNGHLARLAVLPEMQGRGVGSALLHDLLTRLYRRNVQTITVNTQASNKRSQRLYERYGFRRNGYDLPVYITRF